MRLGFGLYRHMLDEDNLAFARQAGVSDIVAHVVDYFSEGPTVPAASSTGLGWGFTDRCDKPWMLDEIAGIQKRVESAGLRLHAIENLDPAHWHDVLLDGPRRDEQVGAVQDCIRILGELGIEWLGYNFSLAGVWGHVRGPRARGGADSLAFSLDEMPEQTAIPAGQVWNMTYDLDSRGEFVPRTSAAELWDRHQRFLADVLPVAERAGVKLCAHPDDPPVPELRGTGRFLTSPAAMTQLLDTFDSDSNCLDFCQGTVSEMPDSDVYALIDSFARRGRIGYVHFRNVHGRIPAYTEAFVDDGYVDMFRALRAYRDAGYDGVLIPDHTPHMTCGAGWHAGMAFALGYMRAALRAVEED